MSKNIDATAKPSLTQCVIKGAFPEQEEHIVKQYWEEIEGIYQSCAEAIVATGDSVQQIINIPGLKEKIANNDDVKAAVSGLAVDLKSFTTELIGIHNKHTGKVGEIKTESDMVLSLTVFDEYMNFSTKFQSVTTPVVAIIMEKVGAVTEELVKTQAEENKEVVTDKTAE